MPRKPRYTPKSFLNGVSRRKTRRGKLKFALVFILLATWAAFYEGTPTKDEVHQYISESVVGSNVQVVDGDTLRINEKSFRLLGIDAPERDQPCYQASGKSWQCGRAARSVLWKMTSGQKIRCDTVDVDKYGRSVAICYAGKVELNREMTKQGFAVAYRYYSKRYVKEEEAAKSSKLGIWQGRFMDPGEWRRRNKN